MIEDNEEDKQMKELVQKWTSLLFECEKDYRLERWENGEGINIIINLSIQKGEMYSTDFVKCPLTISIGSSGYVCFELPEEVEEFIIKKDTEEKEK